MNECCKETYKETLKEVRLSIKKLKLTSIYEVLGMLSIAIFNLDNEDDQIQP